MGDLYEHIATTIKRLRLEAGLSQEMLAHEIGVPGNTVSRWETSTYKPSAHELDKLARFFKVSISIFFPDTQRDDEIPAEAHALFSATRDLTKDDLNEVTRYAEFRRARSLLEREKLRPKKKPRAP